MSNPALIVRNEIAKLKDRKDEKMAEFRAQLARLEAQYDKGIDAMENYLKELCTHTGWDVELSAIEGDGYYAKCGVCGHTEAITEAEYWAGNYVIKGSSDE